MIKKISAIALSLVMTFGISGTMVSATTDDHGNDLNTATPVSVSTTISGRIDYAGDEDFFKFIAPRYGDYKITCSSNFDTIGYLYNETGMEEASDDDDAIDSINFEIDGYGLGSGDIYYIKAKAVNPNESGGSYSIVITAPVYSATDDHGNTFIEHSDILPNTNVVGRINYSNDYDYFMFKAPKTGTYTIKTTGTTDTWGSLYQWNSGTNPSLIARNEDASGTDLNFLITATLTKDKSYYVIVRHSDFVSTGDYILNVIPQ